MIIEFISLRSCQKFFSCRVTISFYRGVPRQLYRDFGKFRENLRYPGMHIVHCTGPQAHWYWLMHKIQRSDPKRRKREIKAQNTEWCPRYRNGTTHALFQTERLVEWIKIICRSTGLRSLCVVQTNPNQWTTKGRPPSRKSVVKHTHSTSPTSAPHMHSESITISQYKI